MQRHSRVSDGAVAVDRLGIVHDDHHAERAQRSGGRDGDLRPGSAERLPQIKLGIAKMHHQQLRAIWRGRQRRRVLAPLIRDLHIGCPFAGVVDRPPEAVLAVAHMHHVQDSPEGGEGRRLLAALTSDSSIGPPNIPVVRRPPDLVVALPDVDHVQLAGKHGQRRGRLAELSLDLWSPGVPLLVFQEVPSYTDHQISWDELSMCTMCSAPCMLGQRRGAFAVLIPQRLVSFVPTAVSPRGAVEARPPQLMV